MVIRSTIITLVVALATVSCTMTEMPLQHTNPLDTIYDNTEMRMVLTGKSTSSTTATLTWRLTAWGRLSRNSSDLPTPTANRFWWRAWCWSIRPRCM